jgi:3-oxoacyl-[acyl-carrier protein] reductase
MGNALTQGIARAVVVTGAGSGIGAAVCRRLAEPGTGIVVHTRANQAGAQATADAVEEYGGTAIVMLGDFAVPGTATRVVETAIETFGRLDILVANAGFADRRNIGGDLDTEGLAATHRAITGAFLELANAGADALVESGSGRVIGICAYNAHLFRPDMQSFAASASAKSAVEVLARTLAVDLAPRGVTVNVVAPGLIEKGKGGHTPLSPDEWRALIEEIPAKRLGKPDDVAAMVAFVAGPDAAYVTGQIIHVNGGLV